MGFTIKLAFFISVKKSESFMVAIKACCRTEHPILWDCLEAWSMRSLTGP